jgi:sec-independent protein translocase protein TatA
MSSLFALMGLGPMEFVIVGVVILLLFGNRLPSLMRNLGRGVVEFKKGTQDIEDDSDDSATKKPKDSV